MNKIMFVEIDFKRAMEMVAEDNLRNLYFKTKSDSIDCVSCYNFGMSMLKDKQWFERMESPKEIVVTKEMMEGFEHEDQEKNEILTMKPKPPYMHTEEDLTDGF